MKEASTPVTVLDSGLRVHVERPWLRASPDGIIKEEGAIARVVEVKCSYTIRNGLSLKELAS